MLKGISNLNISATYDKSDMIIYEMIQHNTVEPLTSDPLVSDHPSYPTDIFCTDIIYCINMLNATPRQRPPL